MKNSDYYCHKGEGSVLWDAGEPWWAILRTDQGIIDFYSWLLLKHGIEIEKGSRWGAHISFVKGEEPKNKELWFKKTNLQFLYSNQIRYDNGRHAWLDVYCPDLAQMRIDLGLDQQPKMSFHLTLGRLKIERIPTRSEEYLPGAF